MNKKTKIYLVLSIATMVMIFIFSQQNGSQSSGLTVFVVDLIKKIFGLNGESGGGSFTIFGIPIRKVAHMTVYAMLGFNVEGFLNNWKRIFPSSEGNVDGKTKNFASGNKRRAFLVFATSLLWCLIYAISDELHQYFIPGRACQIKDVGFDMCGAAVAVVIYSAFYAIRIKRKVNSEDSHE